MGAPPPLESERLALTAIGPEDALRITALCNNWNVSRWLARAPYPYLLEDAEAFCRLVADTAPAGRDAVWAIRLKGEKGLIGVISVTGLKSDEPELGYWLGEPYWGHRLMSEAAGAVVADFFARGRHATLHSGAFTGNEASLRIQYRLGFQDTATGVRWCLARSADVEHIFTRLTRTAWQARAATA